MFTQLYNAFSTWFPSMMYGLGRLWDVFINESLVDILSDLALTLDPGIIQTLFLEIIDTINVQPFNEPLISFTLGASLIITLAITLGKWTISMVS